MATPVEERQAKLAIREALDALAVVPIRDEILRRALKAIDRDEIPEAGELASFVHGPLRDAVVSLFDERTADVLVKSLVPVVGRAGARESGVVRRVKLETEAPPASETRRVVIFLGNDRGAYAPLARELEGAAVVQLVEDVLEIGDRITDVPVSDLCVVVDTRQGRPRAGRIGSIARQLRPGTRVILWGATADDAKLFATGRTEVQWLPVSAEAAVADVALLCVVTSSSGARLQPKATERCILVVSQHQSTRRVLGDRIAQKGHSVLLAGTAAEALAMCAQRRPDLVFAEQDLPGVDATEMARLLRRAAGKNAPPVVLLVSDLLEASALASIAAAVPKDLAADKVDALLKKLAV